MTITYKQLKTLEDLIPCEKLQETVWKFSQSDIIPPRFMRVLCKHGGFAMGAFDDGMMVGFVFGVPAIHFGRPSQHSHMLAVLPEHHNKNIGFNLKKAQREDALNRDIDLITWAFDPLQSKNAYLNINKLGITASNYDINLYGENSSSKLHSGLGTDRLLAEWWLVSDRVKSIVDGNTKKTIPPPSNSLNIIETERDTQGLLTPVEPDLTLTNKILLLEIPDNIDKMKDSNIQVARLWRRLVQKTFIHYFDAGYYVNSLQIEQEGNTRRVYYVLEYRTEPQRPVTDY